MIVGKAQLTSWFAANEVKYWKLRNDDGSLIAECDNKPNISSKDSQNKLDQFLGFLAPGNYSIDTWQTEGQKKDWLKTRFMITQEEGVKTQHVSGQALDTAAIERMVKDRFDSFKESFEREQREKKLKEEVSELRKRLKEAEPGVFERILKRAEPVINGLIDGRIKKGSVIKRGVSGDKKNGEEKKRETPEEIPKHEEELAKTLAELEEARPEDFDLVLKKFAILARKDPDTFASAIGMLNGAVSDEELNGDSENKE